MSESTLTPDDLERLALINKLVRYSGRKREKEIQEAFVKRLREQGEEPRVFVRCAAGIADVVTDGTVYEIEARLDRHKIFQAVGQVLLYRRAINLAASACIVGGNVRKAHWLLRLVRGEGIRVLLWEEEKGFFPFEG